MNYKKIIGEKCYLSPITPDLSERWAEWLNDFEVSLLLGEEVLMLLNTENQAKMIDDSISDPGRTTRIFSIVDLRTENPIGRCMIFNVNENSKNAMVGIFIGEKEYWNGGYGTEALSLLVDFGFNLMNLNSIMLGVFAFNKRAIACYKNVGFKEIGIRRKARVIAGESYDVLFMDILPEEFESPYVKRELSRIKENLDRN